MFLGVNELVTITCRLQSKIVKRVYLSVEETHSYRGVREYPDVIDAMCGDVRKLSQYIT